jgi:hypothetical protein
MDKTFSELTAEEISFLSISWLLDNKPDIDLVWAMEYKCPTCLGFIPNNDRIGEYSGAISRKDNKTEICSACGTNEALLDWYHKNG